MIFIGNLGTAQTTLKLGRTLEYFNTTHSVHSCYRFRHGYCPLKFKLILRAWFRTFRKLLRGCQQLIKAANKHVPRDHRIESKAKTQIRNIQDSYLRVFQLSHETNKQTKICYYLFNNFIYFFVVMTLTILYTESVR